MRAAVIEELGRPLVVRDVAEPSCPADGAIVRVMANGICRTDWALWSDNFWAGGPRISAPFVLGHEFAGVVEEVGSAVRRWHAGDRVTFPMNPGDGTCVMCRAGHQHVCAHGDTLVPGVSYWGAFAEYVVVRFADVNMVALPESLGFVAAASLGCRYIAAFHGIVDQARVRPGDWVAIYGAGGGMGLAAVQIAAAAGANVIAVDISDDKLAAARRLGAVHVTKATALDAASEIVELTAGGAHVSIDAIGLAQTCEASVHSLRSRGRHLQLGHTVAAAGGRIAVPIDLMLIKELEFLSAFGMAGHQFDAMIAMIEAGRLRPDEIVSRTVGLDEVTAVLESMETFGTAGVVVIDRF